MSIIGPCSRCQEQIIVFEGEGFSRPSCMCDTEHRWDRIREVAEECAPNIEGLAAAVEWVENEERAQVRSRYERLTTIEVTDSAPCKSSLATCLID